MAQKTWAASDILTAADMNLYASREGGAWTTWTPSVTQSASVTVTVTEATYARAGRLIQFSATLTVTGSGTAGNDIVISLPVATKSGYTVRTVLGDGSVFDTSATADYTGVLKWVTTTTMKIKSHANSSASAFLGSVSFADGLASNDVISVRGFYEAAS